MNKIKISLGLLVLALALVVVPGASAVPTYYAALQSIYGGPTTCQLDCHTSLGGPFCSGCSFTAYGTVFSSNASHSTDPAGVLIAIGPPVASIKVSPTIVNLSVGGKQPFTAAQFDSFGNQFTSNLTVKWTSSNMAVGTIDPTTGMFTAVGAGNVIITATGGGIGSGTITGNATVTVTAVSVPVLTTIKVSPATVNLSVGGNQTFTAAGFAQNGATIAISPAVVWSSSNTTVGTINSSTGVFNALATGTTTVTANNGTNGTVSGTANVTVTATPPPTGKATVTFVVTDSHTNRKIVHAQVTMDGITINTNSKGKAVFTGVALGTHLFKASKQPYIDFVGSVNVTGNTTVSVKLVRGKNPVEKDVNEQDRE